MTRHVFMLIAFLTFTTQIWGTAMKLDNTRLLVTKFDETFLFYKDKLNLEVTFGNVGGVYADFKFPGGGQLALFKREMMADTVGTSELPITVQAQDTKALIIRVQNVDKEYDKLKALGIPFVTEPTNRPQWGIRTAHLRDPDNNLIEMFSELKENE